MLVSHGPWWWIRVFPPGAVVTIDEYRLVEPATGAETAIARSMSAFWPVPAHELAAAGCAVPCQRSRARSRSIWSRPQPAGLEVAGDAPVALLDRRSTTRRHGGGAASVLSFSRRRRSASVGASASQSFEVHGQIGTGQRVVAPDLVERDTPASRSRRAATSPVRSLPPMQWMTTGPSASAMAASASPEPLPISLEELDVRPGVVIRDVVDRVEMGVELAAGRPRRCVDARPEDGDVDDLDSARRRAAGPAARSSGQRRSTMRTTPWSRERPPAVRPSGPRCCPTG